MNKKTLNTWMTVIVFLLTIVVAVCLGRLTGSVLPVLATLCFGFGAMALYKWRNDLQEKLDEGRFGKPAGHLYVPKHLNRLEFDCHFVKAACTLVSLDAQLKLKVEFSEPTTCLVQITGMNRHLSSNSSRDAITSSRSFVMNPFTGIANLQLLIDLPTFGNGTDQILVSFRAKSSYLNEMFAVIIPEPELPVGRIHKRWSELYPAEASA